MNACVWDMGGDGGTLASHMDTEKWALHPVLIQLTVTWHLQDARPVALAPRPPVPVPTLPTWRWWGGVTDRSQMPASAKDPPQPSWCSGTGTQTPTSALSKHKPLLPLPSWGLPVPPGLSGPHLRPSASAAPSAGNAP